jgi:hypothetical protein
MIYPEYMTKEDIAEFERKYNEWLDEERAYHDHMERDHDESYESDYSVSWYDEQYELEADYL